jgi:hypothetical protein
VGLNCRMMHLTWTHLQCGLWAAAPWLWGVLLGCPDHLPLTWRHSPNHWPAYICIHFKNLLFCIILCLLLSCEEEAGKYEPYKITNLFFLEKDKQWPFFLGWYHASLPVLPQTAFELYVTGKS